MKTEYLEKYLSIVEDVVLFVNLCNNCQRAGDGERWVSSYLQDVSTKVVVFSDLVEAVLEELADNIADSVNPEGVFDRYKERLCSHNLSIAKKGKAMIKDAVASMGLDAELAGDVLDIYNDGVKAISNGIKDLRLMHDIKALERVKGKSLVTISPEAIEQFKGYFKLSFTKVNENEYSRFNDGLIPDLRKQHTKKELATLALALYDADIIKPGIKRGLSFKEWLRTIAEIFQTPDMTDNRPAMLHPDYNRYYYLQPKNK